MIKKIKIELELQEHTYSIIKSKADIEGKTIDNYLTNLIECTHKPPKYPPCWCDDAMD